MHLHALLIKFCKLLHLTKSFLKDSLPGTKLHLYYCAFTTIAQLDQAACTCIPLPERDDSYRILWTNIWKLIILKSLKYSITISSGMTIIWTFQSIPESAILLFPEIGMSLPSVIPKIHFLWPNQAKVAISMDG